MDHRHAVALILGLVLCLGLLSRWAVRPDDQVAASGDLDALPEQPEAGAPSSAEPDEVIRRVTRAAAEAVAEKATNDSGVFRGRIINAATREPVRKFDLEFQPVRPKREAPESPLHSFDTKDGRFQARDVPAGIWTVFVSARGYQRFELSEVAIASGTSAGEILIPMRPGHALSGRVFDESTDQGLAGVSITFREAHIDRFEGDFRNRPGTTSGQDGAFTLEGLPEGPVILTAAAPNYGSKQIDVMAGNKMSPVEIGLSAGGSISGYLTGSDAATPLAGFISLANLDESSAATTRTGPAGEFSFTRLSPGRYRLSGRAAGMGGDREIALSQNEQLAGIVLPMRGGHSIRGVVSGLKAEELGSTVVSIYRDGDYGLALDSAVDERGAYSLQGVKPGRVSVLANTSSRRQITRTVEMPADTDLTVNLEFPRGSRLTGRVTRGGKPLAGAPVSPLAEKSSDKLQFYAYDVRAAANGDYVIEDLPNGEYTLRVDGYRSPSVRISGDTVFDVDVPSGQLTGRLLEEGSDVPVVGATVDVWSAQPASRVRHNTRSDHFGQFAIRTMPPGDFVLSVYKPGYELYRAPLAFNSPISNLTVQLRPARGVEVKISDAVSGEPVNSVTVAEVVNGHDGIYMRLSPDQNGVGHLPRAIAGSTLKFWATGYVPATVTAWDGEAVEISMQREPPLR